MSRTLASTAVLAAAIVVGVLLGPAVLGGAADRGEEPTDPASAVVPTDQNEVTYATDAATPSFEPTEPTAAQAADLAAGVRTDVVPSSGSGELRVVPGSSDPPEGAAPVTTVRVEVEYGLDVDDRAFAAFVMDALNDPRGWGADGSVRFARTDGEADIRVVLATAGTVDDMCAPLATNGKWSCGRYGHAALNADRWFLGAEAWDSGGGDITAYREYMVNHEVGHLLGHPHEQCPGPGEVSPVMVQQSISLGGCEPNAWPNPEA